MALHPSVHILAAKVNLVDVEKEHLKLERKGGEVWGGARGAGMEKGLITARCIYV